MMRPDCAANDALADDILPVPAWRGGAASMASVLLVSTRCGGAAAIALACLLAGCAATVAPPPASSLHTPAAWRSAVEGQGSGPVAREWWQSFGDPALTALVTKALESNGDLRSAA